MRSIANNVCVYFVYFDVGNKSFKIGLSKSSKSIPKSKGPGILHR